MILKWMIVAVLFIGSEPQNAKVFPLDPADFKTEADCQRIHGDLMKEAAAKGVTIWAKCIEVDYAPPP